VILLDVVALVSDIAEYRLLGSEFTLQEADANDARQGVIGVLQFLLLVVTAVFFIRWFKRAYENVPPNRRRYGIGWTIGSWFVPFLNLWRPKQIANDIWRDTNPRVPLSVSEHVSPLLHLWWAAFLASTLISNAAGRAAFSAETIEGLRTTSVMYAIADTIDIAAALLAIWAIRTITARQTTSTAAEAQPQQETLFPQLG
jgi:hypothetical protein